MEIPDLYKINDTRATKDYKEKTFSLFLKKDVLSEFNKSILAGKIEDANHWAVELVCSGMIEKIWDKIFTIFTKNIYTYNPVMPSILYERYTSYLNTIKETKGDMFKMRNIQHVRNHIAELITIASINNKVKTLSFDKITQDHFNSEFIKSKFNAPDDSFSKKFERFGDPDEVKIILNEFAFNLKMRNYEICIYWLSWIFEWEKINIKKNKVFKCGFRSVNDVDQKYYTDLVWFIWEIVLYTSKDVHNDDVFNQIHNLYLLYKINYSTAKRSKKSMFLLNAIKYFTENYKLNKTPIVEYHLIIQVCGNINTLYNGKKKYEINNLKDSQNKMHQMNYIAHQQRLKMEEVNEVKKKKIKTKLDESSVKKINTIGEIDQFLINRAKNPSSKPVVLKRDNPLPNIVNDTLSTPIQNKDKTKRKKKKEAVPDIINEIQQILYNN